MDERRTMLAVQPEVLFTYPSLMGDYDKIGQPSLQDGVRCLTCFSPRDDPVHLPSSTSVAIQCPQQHCRAAGITRLGPDCCFLYFDVVLSNNCGGFRATVRLARTTMEWSHALERRRARYSLYPACGRAWTLRITLHHHLV